MERIWYNLNLNILTGLKTTLVVTMLGWMILNFITFAILQTIHHHQASFLLNLHMHVLWSVWCFEIIEVFIRTVQKNSMICVNVNQDPWKHKIHLYIFNLLTNKLCVVHYFFCRFKLAMGSISILRQLIP